MKLRHLVIAALALAGTAAGGLAQAQDHGSHWSVRVDLPLPPLPPLPHLPRLLLPPGMVVIAPQRDAPVRYDRDRDGIPDHRDRVYTPRWDRDGDGIPNRYDRRDNRRWDRDGDGVPNRFDRRDDRRDDRHEDRREERRKDGRDGWR
jgi:hypothetical protein